MSIDISLNEQDDRALVKYNKDNGYNFTMQDVKDMRLFIYKKFSEDENGSSDVENIPNNAQERASCNLVDDYNNTNNKSFTCDQLSALTKFSFSEEQRCYTATSDEMIPIDCDTIA